MLCAPSMNARPKTLYEAATRFNCRLQPTAADARLSRRGEAVRGLNIYQIESRIE
jgi:hypothetical protein